MTDVTTVQQTSAPSETSSQPMSTTGHRLPPVSVALPSYGYYKCKRRVSQSSNSQKSAKVHHSIREEKPNEAETSTALVTDCEIFNCDNTSSPQTRPDSQPKRHPVSRPDSQTDRQPGSLPDSQTDSLPDSHPDSLPDSHPDSLPYSHPDICPGSRLDSRPRTPPVSFLDDSGYVSPGRLSPIGLTHSGVSLVDQLRTTILLDPTHVKYQPITLLGLDSSDGSTNQCTSGENEYDAIPDRMTSLLIRLDRLKSVHSAVEELRELFLHPFFDLERRRSDEHSTSPNPAELIDIKYNHQQTKHYLRVSTLVAGLERREIYGKRLRDQNNTNMDGNPSKRQKTT